MSGGGGVASAGAETQAFPYNLLENTTKLLLCTKDRGGQSARVPRAAKPRMIPRVMHRTLKFGGVDLGQIDLISNFCFIAS